MSNICSRNSNDTPNNIIIDAVESILPETLMHDALERAFQEISCEISKLRITIVVGCAPYFYNSQQLYCNVHKSTFTFIIITWFCVSLIARSCFLIVTTPIVFASRNNLRNLYTNSLPHHCIYIAVYNSPNLLRPLW